MSEEQKKQAAEEPREFDRNEEMRQAWAKASARMRVSVRKARRLAHASMRETAEIAIDAMQGHCNCGAKTAKAMLEAETASEALNALHRRARLAPRRCLRNAERIRKTSAKGMLDTVREMTKGINKALDAFGDMRVL